MSKNKRQLIGKVRRISVKEITRSNSLGNLHSDRRVQRALEVCSLALIIVFILINGIPLMHGNKKVEKNVEEKLIVDTITVKEKTKYEHTTLDSNEATSLIEVYMSTKHSNSTGQKSYDLYKVLRNLNDPNMRVEGIIITADEEEYLKFEVRDGSDLDDVLIGSITGWSYKSFHMFTGWQRHNNKYKGLFVYSLPREETEYTVTVSGVKSRERVYEGR